MAAREIVGLAGYLENQNPIDGRAAAYVCEDYVCRRSTTDPDELRSMRG